MILYQYQPTFRDLPTDCRFRGKQKSVLAKQCHTPFVTGDVNGKGPGCNSFGILHLKLPWSKWAMCR